MTLNATGKSALKQTTLHAVLVWIRKLVLSPKTQSLSDLAHLSPAASTTLAQQRA